MTAHSRFQRLTNNQGARVEPLLPSNVGRRGRPFRDNRLVVEGIIYRYPTGVPWRDLPERYGPWQTVWKRHNRYCTDGMWDRLLARIPAEADALNTIDWDVSVDATINPDHQHGTNTTRPDQPTGCFFESHEATNS